MQKFSQTGCGHRNSGEKKSFAFSLRNRPKGTRKIIVRVKEKEWVWELPRTKTDSKIHECGHTRCACCLSKKWKGTPFPMLAAEEASGKWVLICCAC